MPVEAKTRIPVKPRHAFAENSIVPRKHGWPFLADEITKARFLARPNRFLVWCENDGGQRINAFLPNPGRLWELLLPGATLYLHRPRERARGVGTRKTRHTVLAVERDGHPVFLHTHETNRAAQYLLENDLIPPLRGSRIVRAEVARGKSRFDFLLERDGRDVYLEVKSCTLFGNGIAMFPDAVTTRGRRHLLELADMSRQGTRSAVLFLVHTPDVRWFMPDYHTDIDFSRTLLDVRQEVEIIPAAIRWNGDLTLDHQSTRILSIPWDHLKREVEDRGSYLLIVKVARQTRLQAGGLAAKNFAKGYYVYVGSAMSDLSARLARHQRETKKLHWHIDYLTAKADRMIALPIRSSQRLECGIAEALSAILDPGPRGFGSSDCRCATHLFFSPTEPLHTAHFHQVLQRFRMKYP
jgi:sugar fermentation stimulation protein A